MTMKCVSKTEGYREIIQRFENLLKVEVRQTGTVPRILSTKILF